MQNPAVTHVTPGAGVVGCSSALYGVPALAQAGRSRAAFCNAEQLRDNLLLTCLHTPFQQWLSIREQGWRMQAAAPRSTLSSAVTPFQGSIRYGKNKKEIKVVVTLSWAPPANKAPPTWESRMRCFLQDYETANQGSACALKLVPS